MDKDPPMKVSFMVEVTRCGECPHFHRTVCMKNQTGRSVEIVRENAKQLTKTCPMVRAQFEALE